jgi:HSP20 family protein
MEELEIKSNPIHPIWYNSDENQPIARGKRWRNGVRSPVWRPPTDVFETDEAVIVRVDIAGMKEEDFSISLTGDQLNIKGNRPDIQERRAYHQMEIFFGDFSTEIKLPGPVLVDEIVAEYQSGILRLSFPKEKPTKIQVSE